MDDPQRRTGGGRRPAAGGAARIQGRTGLVATGPFIPLSTIQQKGGKVVHAWAFAGDCDPETIKSNFFTIEWPPKSGKQQEFPKSIEQSGLMWQPPETKIKAGQVRVD